MRRLILLAALLLPVTTQAASLLAQEAVHGMVVRSQHLDTDADAATIAEKLTAIGLEVESVTDPGAALKDFVVGEVVTAEKHPNADKLRLCTVNDGKDTLQIVCGAPNARAGIKVVLARPGTVIPASDEALKFGKNRDVESRGMM